MLEVTCPNCALRILVPPTVQGRWATCFGCGSRVMAPSVSDPKQGEDVAYQPGQRVSDRYLIEAALGKGGMGVVYRAHDELMNERVALKFMRPRLLRTDRGQRLFIQEAQLARRLRHENIVTVHDVSRTPDGILYLSMEFLHGLSLRAYIWSLRGTRGQVEVRLAVRVAAQVLSALEYAHKTVVHRDIKPENVMLLPGERVKMLDFGLARAIDEEPVQSETPGPVPSRPAGTSAYAAPEQRLRREVDSRVDLYSAGLVLRELFTLRTPLEDQVPIEAVRQDVAPSLLAVIEKALCPEKEGRWQTAAEFRQKLLHAYDESYRAPKALQAEVGARKTASTDHMAYLEGGSFLMGSNDSPGEAPEREVHLAPYYIDRYPVTTEQYAAFLEATGRTPPKFWGRHEFSGPRQPVIGVTWDDAAAYAAWAGKQLPTEAQWEYAARGKDNRRYPWGNRQPDPTRSNYGDHLNVPSIVTMHEEGGTPEGIHDLAGNVYEWTQDWFAPYTPDLDAANGDPGAASPPSAAPRRVVRGGSWHSNPRELLCTFRKGLFPESQLPTLGFRCVVPVSAESS